MSERAPSTNPINPELQKQAYTYQEQLAQEAAAAAAAHQTVTDRAERGRAFAATVPDNANFVHGYAPEDRFDATHARAEMAKNDAHLTGEAARLEAEAATKSAEATGAEKLFKQMFPGAQTPAERAHETETAKMQRRNQANLDAQKAIEGEPGRLVRDPRMPKPTEGADLRPMVRVESTPSRRDEILGDLKYGRTVAEREATADAHRKDYDNYVAEGLEPAQALLLANMRTEEGPQYIANMAAKLRADARRADKAHRIRQIEHEEEIAADPAAANATVDPTKAEAFKNADPAVAEATATAAFERRMAALKANLKKNEIYTKEEYAAFRGTHTGPKEGPQKAPEHSAALNEMVGLNPDGSKKVTLEDVKKMTPEEIAKLSDFTKGDLVRQAAEKGEISKSDYLDVVKQAKDALDAASPKGQPAGSAEKYKKGPEGGKDAKEVDQEHLAELDAFVPEYDDDPKAIEMEKNAKRTQDEFAAQLALMHAKGFGGKDVTKESLQAAKNDYLKAQKDYYDNVWTPRVKALTNPDGSRVYSDEDIAHGRGLKEYREGTFTNNMVEYHRLQDAAQRNEKKDKEGNLVSKVKTLTKIWVQKASGSKAGRQIRRALGVGAAGALVGAAGLVAHKYHVNLLAPIVAGIGAGAAVNRIRNDMAAAPVEGAYGSNDGMTPVIDKEGGYVTVQEGDTAVTKLQEDTVASAQRRAMEKRLYDTYNTEAKFSAEQIADTLVASAEAGNKRNTGRIWKAAGAAATAAALVVAGHEMHAHDVGPFDWFDGNGNKNEGAGGDAQDGRSQQQEGPGSANAAEGPSGERAEGVMEDGKVTIDGKEYNFNYDAKAGDGWIKYIDNVASQNGLDITRDQADKIFYDNQQLFSGENFTNYSDGPIPGPDQGIGAPGNVAPKDGDIARIIAEQIAQAAKANEKN
jgi:hypothetical protein